MLIRWLDKTHNWKPINQVLTSTVNSNSKQYTSTDAMLVHIALMKENEVELLEKYNGSVSKNDLAARLVQEQYDSWAEVSSTFLPSDLSLEDSEAHSIPQECGDLEEEVQRLTRQLKELDHINACDLKDFMKEERKNQNQEWVNFRGREATQQAWKASRDRV